MNLDEATQIAKNSQIVKNLRKEGWFLCSVLTECKPGDDFHIWKFDYFNNKTQKVRTLTIDDKGTKLGEDDQMLGEAEEFYPNEVIIKPEKALDRVIKDFNEPLQKIIITNKKNDSWNIVLLTRLLNMVIYKVDMRSGEIIMSEKTSLLKRSD